MKLVKTIALLLLLGGIFNTIAAQKLHFASITDNGEKLNNIPRFSIGIPFTFNLNKNADKFLMHGGGTLKTEGVTFNRDADKIKMRTWTIGPVINFILKQEKTFILLGYGADYNFHYKERLFPNSTREGLTTLHTEWNSDRVKRFNHYARVGFGVKQGAYIYAEYFFDEFLNQGFTEVNDMGQTIMPYNGLEINRFNIGISFLMVNENAFDGDEDDKDEERVTKL